MLNLTATTKDPQGQPLSGPQCDEVAERIAKQFGGRVWSQGGLLRVYIGKGYAEVTQRGVNINEVKSAQFMAVKPFVEDLGVEAFRF